MTRRKHAEKTQHVSPQLLVTPSIVIPYNKKKLVNEIIQSDCLCSRGLVQHCWEQDWRFLDRHIFVWIKGIKETTIASAPSMFFVFTFSPNTDSEMSGLPKQPLLSQPMSSPLPSFWCPLTLPLLPDNKQAVDTLHSLSITGLFWRSLSPYRPVSRAERKEKRQ